MANELTVKDWSFDDVERVGMALAKSQLFGVKTPEQAIALCLLAQAEGMHPAIAARDFDIIQGRPAKKSEAMLRSFLESGGSVKWHALDDTQADATFSHPKGGEVRIKWDMKRAQTAGLAGKDMWKKYPRPLLRARCISEGVRTVCPLATSGLYVPEEVRDMEKDVTAESSVVERHPIENKFQEKQGPQQQEQRPLVVTLDDALASIQSAKDSATLRRIVRHAKSSPDYEQIKAAAKLANDVLECGSVEDLDIVVDSLRGTSMHEKTREVLSQLAFAKASSLGAYNNETVHEQEIPGLD